MVVYAIKDPAGNVSAAQPKLSRADMETATAVQQSHAIGMLLGGSRAPRGRERFGRKRPHLALDPVALREVSRLVDEINAHLEAQGTQIHLVLVAGDDGVAIDLYDCSDSNVCRSIHDITIEIHDLPILLARLMQKTGIIVDTLL